MMVRYWLPYRKKFIVEKALLNRISSRVSSLLYSISSRSSGKKVVPCTYFSVTDVFKSADIFAYLHCHNGGCFNLLFKSLLFKNFQSNWHFFDFLLKPYFLCHSKNQNIIRQRFQIVSTGLSNYQIPFTFSNHSDSLHI